VKLSDVLKDVSLLRIDTAPIIYFIEKRDPYYAKMQTVVSAITNGSIAAYSSTMTLTEVLVQPLKVNNSALVEEYEDVLLNSPNFSLMPIDVTVSRTAARLRAQHNLKTPDAIQVATAIESQCEAFLTNDIGLKRVKELQTLVLDELE